MTETSLEPLAPALAQLYLHEDLGWFKQDSHQALARLAPDDGHRDALAASMATMFYYTLPLPGRGFKSETPPTPGRNDPCDCGSGKKYKKCCGRIGKPPAIPYQGLFQIAMSAFGPDQWQKLAEHPDLPSELRELMLEHCMQTGQPAMADLIAQPLYRRVASLTRRDEGGFSIAMDALADIMPTAKRRQRQEELLEQAKSAPIRSILHQRLAMRYMEEGDINRARQHLTEARQADPDQMEIPLAELSILAFTGSEDVLVERARWWQTRLRKRHGPDYPWRDFIEDVIERGKVVMDAWDSPMSGDTLTEDIVLERIDRLHDILTRTPVIFTDEMTRERYLECSVKTARKLAKPARRLLKDVYSLEETGAGSRLALDDLLSPPDGEWLWTSPDADWLGALEARPDLLGNVTVLLALYELVQACPDETGHGQASLIPHLMEHINYYFNTVLGSLKDQGYLNHRTINGHAIAVLIRSHLLDLRHVGEPDMALRFGEQYLELHPGDPSAVRVVLASFYAEQGRVEAATALKDQYQNGQNPELAASLMQAHAFTGDYGNALKQLNHLVSGYPSAFRELAKYITGIAQAEPWATSQPFHGMDAYWNLNAHLWNARLDALDWLNRNLP